MSDVLLGQLNCIEIGMIFEAEDNPRTVFDDIDTLASTFTKTGALQPITVRPAGDNFEIIDGARRYRAALHRGDEFMQCIVHNVTHAEATRLRLIANLQRDDLTAIDEALAIKRYKETGNLSTSELMETLGMSKTRLYASLSLAELPEQIHTLFRDKSDSGFILTQKHGEILHGLLHKNDDALVELAELAYTDCLSCEKLGQLVKKVGKEETPAKPQPAEAKTVETLLEPRFEDFGGTVSVKAKKDGTLVVSTKTEISPDDLQSSLFALFGIEYDTEAAGSPSEGAEDTENSEAAAGSPSEVQEVQEVERVPVTINPPSGTAWEFPNVLLHFHTTDGSEILSVYNSLSPLLRPVVSETHPCAVYRHDSKGTMQLGYCKEIDSIHAIARACEGVDVELRRNYGQS